MRAIFALALLFLIACNNAQKEETMQMSGAYTMQTQDIYGGSLDTIITSLKQMKLFTGSHIMYARFQPDDSTSGFGIGTYTVNRDTLTEHIFYAAANNGFSDEPRSYNLGIAKNDSGYTQTIPDMVRDSQLYRLMEEYVMIKDSTVSPLDGAWKLTKAYDITGNDTIPQQITQYKVYYAGHFMFGNTYTDSAGTVHTGIGYGRFVMNGTTKSTESVAVSTYSTIKGRNISIDIEMNGNDAYKQTFQMDKGAKLVEEYQRLRK